MIPAFAIPNSSCNTPPTITARRKVSKPPNSGMAVITIAAKPAAGPLTPRGDPLIKATTVPPTIPAIKPEKSGAPEAKAIPKHSGKATKNTTILAGKSFFRFEKNPFLTELIIFIFTLKECIGNN